MGVVSSPDRTTHSACLLGYSCKAHTEDDSRGVHNQHKLPWCMRCVKLSQSSCRTHAVKGQNISSQFHFSHTTRRDKQQHRQTICNIYKGMANNFWGKYILLALWEKICFLVNFTSNIIINFCMHAFHTVINFCTLLTADATQKSSQHGMYCQFYTVKLLYSGSMGPVTKKMP